MNQLNVIKHLHYFLVYAILGTFVAYVISLYLTRKGQHNPQLGSRLFLISLAVTYLGYIFFHIFWNKFCTVLTGVPMISALSQIACQGGYWLAGKIRWIFPLALTIGVARVGLGMLFRRRLLRRYGFNQLSAHPGVAVTVEGLVNRAGIKAPRVIISGWPGMQAFSTGIFHPVIVISRGLVEGLSSGELEAVLAHEIAHLKRRDPVINQVAVFCRDLMFFNPVAYWALEGMQEETEWATDDLAVHFTQKPLIYAAALLKVWKTARRPAWGERISGSLLAGSNFLRHRANLAGRVNRVINPGVEVHWSKLKIAGFIIIITGFLVVLC